MLPAWKTIGQRGAPRAAGAGVAKALEGHHHGQALLRGQLQLLAHLHARPTPVSLPEHLVEQRMQANVSFNIEVSRACKLNQKKYQCVLCSNGSCKGEGQGLACP